MKFSYVAIFLLAVLAVGLPNQAAGQAESPCVSPGCTVTVSRSISTNDWGVTFLNDTVSLNSTSPVTFLVLGIPLPVADHLQQMVVVDNQGTAIQWSKLTASTGNYQPFKFSFGTHTGSYSFTVKGVFSRLLSFSPSPSPGRFSFNLSEFPVVDNSVRVSKAEVNVKTGDWPNPVISGINVSISGGEYKASATLPFQAFNTTTRTISFAASGTSQNIFDVSASRSLTLSPSGPVHVSDSYNLTNRGKEAQTIKFSLPIGASSVVGSDVIGELDETKVVTVASPNGTTSVTFTPRFGSVKSNGSATLVLKYELSATRYVSTNSLGRYTLSFQMFNEVKFVQPVLQTKIMLPTGFRKGSLPTQAQSSSDNPIILQTSSVGPLSDLSFTMTYQVDPFWASLNPLGWASLVEITFAAIALVLASGPKGVVVGAAPTQLITRFAELYDEKSAMRLEAEKMDENLTRGAINKNDYKRRRRVIDLRTSEIDRSLTPVKEQLAAGQTRYQELIKRIERAEAELQVVKTSLADLRNQYRGGRISRELNETLLSDLLRRKERTQQTIDNVIIGLREEAR